MKDQEDWALSIAKNSIGDGKKSTEIQDGREISCACEHTEFSFFHKSSKMYSFKTEKSMSLTTCFNNRCNMI